MARVRVDGIGIPDADSYYERIRGESSLVAYFPLTENHYGRVLDTHGGRLGDVVGSPTVSDAGVPYGGKAMTFDGSGDGTNTTYEAAFNPAVFSVEMWIKPTDTTGVQILCSNRPDTFSGFLIYLNGTSVVFQTQGAGGSQNVQVASSAAAGTWLHMACVYDGTNSTLYLNGAPVAGPTARNYVQNASADLKIAHNDGGNPSFAGAIAHFSLYNAALTPAKINRHYSAFANAVLNLGPVGYWRLNEASGTTATDLGSGGNNGTYTNTPTLGATGGLQDDPATATSVDGGLDQYVSIADDAALDGDGSFSAGYLFKCNDADATTVFFQKAASALNASTGWWCGMIDNDRPRIKITDGTDTAFVDNNGGTDLYDNAWHFLMFVNDATNEELSIYVDGAVAKSGNDSAGPYSDVGSIANTEAVEIMRVLGATNPAADATGQDFMFFDRALSAQEISDLNKLAKNALTPRVVVRS